MKLDNIVLFDEVSEAHTGKVRRALLDLPDEVITIRNREGEDISGMDHCIVITGYDSSADIVTFARAIDLTKRTPDGTYLQIKKDRVCDLIYKEYMDVLTSSPSSIISFSAVGHAYINVPPQDISGKHTRPLSKN